MAERPETPSEVDDEDAKFWLAEIEAAKLRHKGWYKAAEQAEKRYKARCDGEEGGTFGRLNILWANVETQKAAIDDDFGNPQVSRVNASGQDHLARHISTVLEQTIDAAVKEDGDNHEIACAVHDIFLPGRGQVWLELEEVSSDEQGAVAWASAPLKRLKYIDYLEGPGNSFKDLPWVARGHLFSLDDLVRQFGLDKEKAKAIPRNWSLPLPKEMENKSEADKEPFKRARVWEIWARLPEKRRVYVAEGHDAALAVTPDPFRLKRFFPCPRPILANGDESWQTPITDYSRYEDQALELDRICNRIYVLTETLRRRGVADKQFPELKELETCGDNVLIMVDKLKLDAKGGLRNAVEWEDLTANIAVLQQLHEQRASLITTIYELSGISDLARGQTDPNETLGAQKLKKTFGSSRFSMREEAARRFAAEAYALKGEVIAEHFPRDQIQEMSGVPLPTEQERKEARQALQALQQAAQQGGQSPEIDPYDLAELQGKAQAQCTWEKTERILRSDRRRCYMVDIETDQTAYMDEEADKKSRVDFMNITNQLMQTFGPMIQANPANGEVFKQIMLFVISSFKAGRSMEDKLERAIDNAIAMAAQSQGQQQQDPKAAADAQVAQSRVQVAQIQQQTAQINLQRAQIEAQGKGADLGVKAQETQLKAIEGQQKVQAAHDTNQAKQVGHAIDMQNRFEQLQFERTQRATAREEILKDNHAKSQTPKGNAK